MSAPTLDHGLAAKSCCINMAPWLGVDDASCTLHIVRRSPLVQLTFLANRGNPWLSADTLLCQCGMHGLLSTAPFALMQVLKPVVL